MQTRREFFKKVALASSGASIAAPLLASIQKASAIEAPKGSTYLDAEHVVILMQENRSFDHTFGTLRGVRGFNDPRAVTLPDQNPVWLQTNAAGETYAPFRLNIQETKSTWLGGLPHSWRDQTDARNKGNHDKWLDAKPSGHPECQHMPLTMGYYNREDIPFYYALADAFTICDQHFCSSLTGTTPNRLYLWTGTIREKQHADAQANVRNSDVDYGLPVRWPTFPERLEEAGISWRIYQNELSLPSGLTDEEDSWLANFTDNPIEWFSQYNVGFSNGYRQFIEAQAASLPSEIEALKKKIEASSGDAGTARKLNQELHEKEAFLKIIPTEREKWRPENFDKLTQRERNLHDKAFTTNVNDPDYRQLTTLQYKDGDVDRELKIPKGDVLHQFREDVKTGRLPTVSWIVAPAKFSDHPGEPWYGAWYLAEVFDILTQNPDVWKKTIFILTYDENDGYFDHVPPFVAPHPRQSETGLTTPDIDASVEYWSLEQDLARKPPSEARGDSIGLGFRVPLVIASPWSRGGQVCSQVFDHTSVLQFLETFLSQKTGKTIHESNISVWRRTVCGDLTSVFKTESTETQAALPFPSKDAFLEGVHKAQFKRMPSGYKQLSSEEIEQVRHDASSLTWMPQQEKGIRPSCALPYQLYVHGSLSRDGKSFELAFEAKNEVFGKKSAGSPFRVYTPGKYLHESKECRVRDYAVTAGHRLTDSWSIAGFENGVYHLRVCGPNGFFREFAGNTDDPALEIQCEYARISAKAGLLSGDVEMRFANLQGSRDYTVHIKDHAYKSGDHTRTIPAGGKASVVLPLNKSFHWYDFSVQVVGFEQFERRYAGRVETGKIGFSDPAMGRIAI